MVIPNSERIVRNLFVTKEFMANEILSFIKPKMIIQKRIEGIQMYQKKLPENLEKKLESKTLEIGFINKKNIYQQSSYKTLKRIKINTFAIQI